MLYDCHGHIPAYFNEPDGNEPLALDMHSMGKGQVWINGQSIGRYWTADATGDCQRCHYTGTSVDQVWINGQVWIHGVLWYGIPIVYLVIHLFYGLPFKGGCLLKTR